LTFGHRRDFALTPWKSAYWCNFRFWTVADEYKKAGLWQRNRTMPL